MLPLAELANWYSVINTASAIAAPQVDLSGGKRHFGRTPRLRENLSFIQLYPIAVSSSHRSADLHIACITLE